MKTRLNQADRTDNKSISYGDDDSYTCSLDSSIITAGDVNDHRYETSLSDPQANQEKNENDISRLSIGSDQSEEDYIKISELDAQLAPLNPLKHRWRSRILVGAGYTMVFGAIAALTWPAMPLYVLGAVGFGAFLSGAYLTKRDQNKHDDVTLLQKRLEGLQEQLAESTLTALSADIMHKDAVIQNAGLNTAIPLIERDIEATTKVLNEAQQRHLERSWWEKHSNKLFGLSVIATASGAPAAVAIAGGAGIASIGSGSLAASLGASPAVTTAGVYGAASLVAAGVSRMLFAVKNAGVSIARFLSGKSTKNDHETESVNSSVSSTYNTQKTLSSRSSSANSTPDYTDANRALAEDLGFQLDFTPPAADGFVISAPSAPIAIPGAKDKPAFVVTPPENNPASVKASESPLTMWQKPDQVKGARVKPVHTTHTEYKIYGF